MLAACGGGGGSGSATSARSDAGSGNSAPTITGAAPASATAGKDYSFKPSATDADKDKVTFTIANKPSWAAFDAATGALTGKPATKDIGTYSGIEIAATDGDAVSALPAFKITVAAATATNSVEVSWAPPTQNADGSTLTDLSGYNIHYGTQSGNYSDSVKVDNAGLTRYSLESLPKGTVYLAMTAVNAAGAESDFSKEVSVTVN
jgi:hypothetical protein